MDNLNRNIAKATELIKDANRLTGFTGAGISVESGVPPFRGNDGIWNKYSPRTLEIDYFHQNPKKSWRVIKKLFYDFFADAQPNKAHYVMAQMEQQGMMKEVITQNIDNLHQAAGSKTVYEFHGNSQYLVCQKCGKRYKAEESLMKIIPPKCPECEGLLKPDFIFFGEPIPQDALAASYEAAQSSDVFLVVGTTGEVFPAAQIPHLASNNGAKIIEVNTGPSAFTTTITDIYLGGKATEIMSKLAENLGL
ncbi:MAG: NAD-dependent deacylase, partial [Bacteroidales bacterium]|nr:NAD-dependent deacylase [Bacteroidales bacterium]